MSDEAGYILLIEDNPNDSELALRVFKKCGFSDSVVVIKDGAEALDYLFATGSFAHRRRELLPRVIFLDLKLPKVGGLEVLEKIKREADTKNIPVVILTSSKEVHDVHESYTLGANSYIVKPLDYENYTVTITASCKYWMSLNHPPS